MEEWKSVEKPMMEYIAKAIAAKAAQKWGFLITDKMFLVKQNAK